MSIHVVRENVKSSKSGVKGTFKLSDKTVIKFKSLGTNNTYGKNGWYQWGNTNENFSLTVDRIESLIDYWIKNYCNT